jgi:D-serine deaminase-like pyridoxal phosphate-dependent protein
MKELKTHYNAEYPNLITSLGDTPTCSTATNFEGVDEIRPGNFVFYDLVQWSLGVCKLEDIAVAMACPIIAKHPDRKELVIYGGGVHFSKDVGNIKGSKTPFYGYVTDIKKTGWENIDLNSFYSKMSQEHGIIKADKNCFEKYNVGDVIGVIPIHSCMTADLFDQYATSEGRIMRL